MALIDTQRASQIAALSSLASSNPSYLASLINAASDLIVRYCKRDFVQTTYTEYYSGGYYTDSPLILRQYPVLSITRVAADPIPAILIQNTDNNTNQRATAASTGTGLILTRVASAVTDTQTVTYAGHATLTALAVAVNALGNGWSATVQGSFGLWPSADLKPLQGAFNCFGGGQPLEIYTEDIQSTASIAGDPTYGGYGWRLDDATGFLYGVFPRGSLNIRIDYTAGYATVPQAIQEATAQLVSHLYNQSATNQALKSERIGEYQYTLSDTDIPKYIRTMLSPFIAHDRFINW